MEVPDAFQKPVPMGMPAIRIGEIGDGDEMNAVIERVRNDAGLFESCHRTDSSDPIGVSGFTIDLRGLFAVDVGVDVGDADRWRAEAHRFIQVVQAESIRRLHFDRVTGQRVTGFSSQTKDSIT